MFIGSQNGSTKITDDITLDAMHHMTCQCCNIFVFRDKRYRLNEKQIYRRVFVITIM